MAQLIPVIGAPVGIVTNYRLIKKLGVTAMNAYRMRLIDTIQISNGTN
ncbi:MAG TPA: EcsC family protein [Hanamia sp.]